ncbi:uncharacterized protein [Typha latifolia]|uniref:uncharacterized protein n=1 Tax=Typha latifolia TaxID=4733 RepID=UPI003C2CB784
MAESRDTHVVEIPTDGESSNFASSAFAAIAHHPLTEISESPGHLLLLKLWQREEDLHGRRTAALESRMDRIKGEAFQLCCLFFAFHGIFLTLLFAASVVEHERRACKNWWVPSSLSLATSLVLVCAVQMGICRYWKVERRLQRERGEGRALARCIMELRMKGASFDLSKEPQVATKRMKSSSVEIKWRPLRWCSENLITMALLGFTGLVFPACKFILCG